MKQPLAAPGNFGDKVQVIVAFAVLALLAAHAYPRARPWVLLFGLSAFKGLIELVQSIPSFNRDADWIEWIAALVMPLGVYLVRRRLRDNPDPVS